MASKLYQVEKNEEDIIRTVIRNTIKMLYERKHITKDQLQDTIKKHTTRIADDNTYKINVQKYLTNDDKVFIVRILPQKITSVGKTSIISDFLNKYKNNPKIVIVKNINKKARQYITNNYPKAEIFLEEELMFNLVDHYLIPKHEVLDMEQNKLIYEKYNCTKRHLPKILSTDPVARYYNMKPGQICRIIRPSETSGYAVSYRRVTLALYK
jgi:DNA-directed RNA polymerase I, II, and III subunit RPABC1